MNFTKIDLEKWDIKESYTWFTTENRCKVDMTVNIDATNLIKKIKELKIRCYPTFIYVVSNSLNKAKEFRMAYNKSGELGYENEEK